jgi:hypothetical protein
MPVFIFRGSAGRLLESSAADPRSQDMRPWPPALPVAKGRNSRNKITMRSHTKLWSTPDVPAVSGDRTFASHRGGHTTRVHSARLAGQQRVNPAHLRKGRSHSVREGKRRVDA